MLEDLSFGKLLIILLVVMVLFGAKKIPDLAQGLGKGIREFKKALKDEDSSPENQEKKLKISKFNNQQVFIHFSTYKFNAAIF